ncbi:peptidase family M13 [Necator americanus]|uniref:Peptidase family M13 n=1 Tax=Necator americanus TaxID=51031 RepID=W2SJF2_NECAM|nr:peptidase family M13 [Necator americanus]ETN69011.1 peptidase family M13 [Necator americanus]
MRYSYQEAAAFIISGLDQNVDPCDDFYAFSCNTYLKNHNVTELEINRIGTYKEAQEDVNADIVDALEPVAVNDARFSETERIVKAALFACVHHSRARLPIDNSRDVLIEMRDLLGAIPFLNHTLNKNVDFFTAMGKLEQEHAMGTLLGAMVSVDFSDVTRHALYISQPYLPLPRDFYVLPQHTKRLQNRVELVSQDIVKLEMQIAMATWPDSEMRNYALQNNPFTLKELEKAYPSIKWKNYFTALLSSVGNLDINTVPFIVTQPSYFAWLNALFAGEAVDRNTIANYLLLNLIFEDADFLGGNFKREVQKSDYVKYSFRRGRGVTRVGRQFGRLYDETIADANMECLNNLMHYMPNGPGYVYVKSKKNREEVAKDVQEQTERVIKHFLRMITELDWMSEESHAAARQKAENLVQNYGWPKDLYGDFSNSATIDRYHKKDYGEILDLFNANNTHNYYKIRKVMIKGYSNLESLKMLKEKPKRQGLIYEYPQAYNYAGQGGTGGHELVHGFDDQGVQFGHDGKLTGCTWLECGWMDSTSKNGFRDMAQCVVTQYSTQCCPEKSGTIQCANGMTTQGENIADVGGQLAAYRAYREYIEEKGEEEKRLPGLEQYTPNQIFWLTYGFSWCMSQTENSLVTQLLVDPHAPGSCRVNQVMQDIPDFGRDFGCTMGQNMYPPAEQRCPVWVAE